jgi:Do/DeqQ family serine protease
MLEKVTPAVVNISTTTRIRIQESPLFSDPFFRHFFNIPDQPREKQSHSLGSGVVIDAVKGFVITNHHVVKKAHEITVTLRDGRTLNAELVGADSETDIALLKVPTEALKALPLGDSDSLQVGDFVVAIGNPFGLGQTVTSGIVSALGRTGLGIEGYEDFIQTDASINPGNSGGALVDLRGELVGINTAIFAPSGGNVGIGFAIPINMVKQIVQQLVQFGEVQRGSIGLQIQDVTPELAEAFGLHDHRGAVVVEVIPNSASEKAGLKTGDVIIAINGQPVHNSAMMRNRVGLLRIGERVKITIQRNGQILQLTAIVSDDTSVEGKNISSFLEGCVLKDSSEGVKIDEVAQQSFAWSVGLRPGDYIIGFNRREVKNIADLQKLMQGQTSSFSIQINREGKILSIWLR